MTSSLPYIGTYKREIPVSVERLYENTLDWEHLPYLHRSSFARIECIRSDSSGFRAWVWPQRRSDPFLLELTLDRQLQRWISRTMEGPGEGTEIWTHAFPVGERRTEVLVDFFVPGILKERVASTCDFYTRLYTRLYDEDVWMMTVRQARLDDIRRKDHRTAPERVSLGSLIEVRARLPLVVEIAGAKFKVVEVGNKLLAYSTVCPHKLGPLEDGEVAAGIVECPWHGYRFDLRTRECLRGQRCSLASAPAIKVDHTEVIAEWIRAE